MVAKAPYKLFNSVDNLIIEWFHPKTTDSFYAKTAAYLVQNGSMTSLKDDRLLAIKKEEDGETFVEFFDKDCDRFHKKIFHKLSKYSNRQMISFKNKTPDNYFGNKIRE